MRRNFRLERHTSCKLGTNKYTVSKKKHDVFEDKLNQKCLFTKNFDNLLLSHRQVFLVSHLTYLVQLLYLGKLSRHKYNEFSLILRIFPMLQY